jgi:prophage DNA circulation protein
MIFALVCSVSAAKKKGGTVADTTSACIMAKEICDYAWEMQKEYETMPDSTTELKQQKKEFIEALNSSVFQCERAKKECAKSVK